MQYQIGDWVIDSASGSLVLGEKNQKLEPKALDVLIYLAENPTKIVSVEELVQKVWDGAVVTDHAVYRAINLIRKTLQTDAQPLVIETISRKGYRLALPVKEQAGAILGAQRKSTPKQTFFRPVSIKICIFWIVNILFFVLLGYLIV